MAQSKVLGVCWRDEHVYFIENKNNSPKHALTFDLPKRTQTDPKKAGDALPSLDNLEPQLKKNHISQKKINLALPTKEIVFRSFMIPLMAPHEIRRVIEFEVSKYVPFALEELNYAYTTVPIQDEKIKRIRVIFVAIKKTSLEQFTREFEFGPYEINWIEPEPVTLVRALIAHKVIQNKETVAVIEQGAQSGRIIVVWKNLPLFVRDFSLISIGDKQDTEAHHKKLINEIRISLDYFHRQDNVTINEIVLVSKSSLQSLDKPLSEILNLPSRVVNPGSILGNDNFNRVGYLIAYGAALVEADKSYINFDLTGKHQDANQKNASIIHTVKKDLKPVLLTLAMCATILGGIWFLSAKKIKPIKTQLDSVNIELGPNQNTDHETLTLKTKTTINKQMALEKVRLTTENTLILETLPQLLPEGTWIENLSIRYRDPVPANIQNEITSGPTEDSDEEDSGGSTNNINGLNLEISGKTYSKDQNNQLRLIKTFMDNLRNNELFAKHFETVSLKSTNTQTFQNYPVTAFKIHCE